MKSLSEVFRWNERRDYATRMVSFSLSPQRGEGRGEGWERAGSATVDRCVELNHPSPSIPLPVEGRGKSCLSRFGRSNPSIVSTPQ